MIEDAISHIYAFILRRLAYYYYPLLSLDCRLTYPSIDVIHSEIWANLNKRMNGFTILFVIKSNISLHKMIDN